MKNPPIDPSCTYSPENFDQAEQAFLANFPQYATTTIIDQLRESDYSRLDKQDQIYLDYTGGGQHADSQLRTHMKLISENVLGNPHSNNPTSLAMTEHVERTRKYVLQYFNADPEEYICCFTSNASGALKLVGESYPFTEGSQYLLTFDNHNSVNGIRMFAASHGAEVIYAPLNRDDLRIDMDKLHGLLHSADSTKHNLFAFPAQSNFSGVKHDLGLIDFAHKHGWDVLVDCAAFAPTNQIDINKLQPDFAACSFYKIFGFPTGLGCLIMRRSKIKTLHRPWFAGGTIQIASVQGNGHYMHENEAAFEDGTVDYLNIPAIETGLRHIESIGIDTIRTRVECLTEWMIDQLTNLKHDNGVPLLKILGPTNMEMRGGTVTFTMIDYDGMPIDDRLVEELATKANISLRTGCFCNPGAGESAHGLEADHMMTLFKDETPVSFSELRGSMLTEFNMHISAVRISLGIASNFRDVYRFMAFMAGFQNAKVETLGGPEKTYVDCRVIG